MKPVNSKSLFTFICDQMEKLDEKTTTVQEAQAQANLAKQACNLLEYERKRAETEFKLLGSAIKVREIESKSFDNTI